MPARNTFARLRHACHSIPSRDCGIGQLSRTITACQEIQTTGKHRSSLRHDHFGGRRPMRKDSESGYILVTVAALLFVLVGFTALAVDMGTVLSSRTQLQRAADAAALAGAFTFNVNPSLTDQPTRASNQALKTATANTVMGIA